MACQQISSLQLGQSRVEVHVQQKHLQPFGMVHGGVYASVADAAAFWAAYTEVEEGITLTTVDLKLNYLAPVSEGYLIAKGRSIKIGKTLCLAEASVEDEAGRMLAHGTSTLMVIDSLKIQGEKQLPPKFLS